jgi:glyoxylase-like metal-dependent hydrolase (beta-lactamase superfamily II)
MLLELQRIEVGPWPMNCYLLRCPVTGEMAIVDPGADAETVLAAVDNARVCSILLTHGHPDHVGALEVVRNALDVPVGIHPADANAFGLRSDFFLVDGAEVKVGRLQVGIAHVPGHTPGSVCLRLNGRAVVGDAIFPGGPGHTTSPGALVQSIESLRREIFCWADDMELHPGHGGYTTVGAERAAFERFVASEPPSDLCGDVAWR